MYNYQILVAAFSSASWKWPTVQSPRKSDGWCPRMMRGNVRKGLRSTQSSTKFVQNLREIHAKFARISHICLKNVMNFSSRDQLKACAFSAAEIRAWNGEEATSELTDS